MGGDPVAALALVGSGSASSRWARPRCRRFGAPSAPPMRRSCEPSRPSRWATGPRPAPGPVLGASGPCVSLAAIAYALATVAVVGFQVALAAGAPWGEYAMGGRVPGKLPPPMRVAAAAQAAVLGLLAVVVLDAGGVIALGWTAAIPWLAWVPVAVSAVSAVMNALTPSIVERRLWLPVAIVLLVSSAIVAVSMS